MFYNTRAGVYSMSRANKINSFRFEVFTKNKNKEILRVKKTARQCETFLEIVVEYFDFNSRH